MCIYVCRIGKFVHFRNSANLQKDQYMHNNQNSQRQKLKKSESSQKENEHNTHCLEQFKYERHEQRDAWL